MKRFPWKWILNVFVHVIDRFNVHSGHCLLNAERKFGQYILGACFFNEYHSFFRKGKITLVLFSKVIINVYSIPDIKSKLSPKPYTRPKITYWRKRTSFFYFHYCVPNSSSLSVPGPIIWGRISLLTLLRQYSLSWVVGSGNWAFLISLSKFDHQVDGGRPLPLFCSGRLIVPC